MRHLILALLLIVPFSQAEELESTPVLIELFTSQGCSSCPPADAELSNLIREQPIDGVEIIALSQHVDYWNSLGWEDPFSDAIFTRRQREYAHQLNSGVYTPQLVIDGRFELVGSRSREVRQAIRSAAERNNKRPLTFDAVEIDDGQLRATLRSADGEPLPKRARLWVALIENGIAVDVARGENAGRDLRHDAVTRFLGVTADDGRVELTLDPGWNAEQLRLVGFLQQRRDGAIVGAVSRPVY